MNKDYEILNEKIDYMFEEIMILKKGLLRQDYEKTEKELKYKLEEAQHELDRHKENLRWQFENLDERRKYFRTIKDRFPTPLEKPIPIEKVD